MTWQYMVTKETSFGEDLYEIKEVYYEGDSVWMVAEDASSPCGGTVEELRRDLESMLGAFKRPVMMLDSSGHLTGEVENFS